MHAGNHSSHANLLHHQYSSKHGGRQWKHHCRILRRILHNGDLHLFRLLHHHRQSATYTHRLYGRLRLLRPTWSLLYVVSLQWEVEV